MTHAALHSILQCAGVAPDLADNVKFVGQDPVFPTPYRIGAADAASLAAVGLALADLRTRHGAQPARVEIDVRAAAASLRSSVYVQIDGKPGRAPLKSVHGFYPAAAGRWNYFHCNQPPHLRALLRVLGVPAERERVADVVSRWDAFELENAVNEAGGCAPAVRTPDEWRALPNTDAVAREPLIEIVRFADSPPMPVPPADRPLRGIRALDLTRVLAGPTCGRLLAEYGAEVLKITCERYPDAPDMELDTGYGKRTAMLDIASPAGRKRLESLLSECDVFCQAYRLGALDALGFSRERVAALRPGIVYASLNAFGFTGPWRGRRGFDTVVQSASGMAYVSGRGKEPRLMPVSSLDYVTGYLLTFGVLVALTRRAEQGGSYAVNVSLARTSEWISSMGLLDTPVVDAASPELASDELARWLIDVQIPHGRLTRLRPIIRFSDGALEELPVWRTPPATDASWAHVRHQSVAHHARDL